MKKLTRLNTQPHSKLVEYIINLEDKNDKLNKLSDKHYNQTVKQHREISMINLDRKNLREALDRLEKAHVILHNQIVASNRDNAELVKNITASASRIKSIKIK